MELEVQSDVKRIDVERPKLRRLGWRAVRTKTQQSSNASMQTGGAAANVLQTGNSATAFGLEKGRGELQILTGQLPQRGPQRRICSVDRRGCGTRAVLRRDSGLGRAGSLGACREWNDGT